MNSSCHVWRFKSKETILPGFISFSLFLLFLSISTRGWRAGFHFSYDGGTVPCVVNGSGIWVKEQKDLTRKRKWGLHLKIFCDYMCSTMTITALALSPEEDDWAHRCFTLLAFELFFRLKQPDSFNILIDIINLWSMGNPHKCILNSRGSRGWFHFLLVACSALLVPHY